MLGVERVLACLDCHVCKVHQRVTLERCGSRVWQVDESMRMKGVLRMIGMFPIWIVVCGLDRSHVCQV